MGIILETNNLIVGGTIIVINVLPFLFRDSRYVFLTAALSTLLAFLLQALRA